MRSGVSGRQVLRAFAAVLATLALFAASYEAALALRGPLRATERVYVPVVRVRHVPGPVRVRRVYVRVPVTTVVTAPAPRPRKAPRPPRKPRRRKTPGPSACPPPSVESSVTPSPSPS